MCDGESRAGHQSFGSLEAAANRSDTIGMPQHLQQLRHSGARMTNKLQLLCHSTSHGCLEI